MVRRPAKAKCSRFQSGGLSFLGWRMIGKLRGAVDAVGAEYAVIDVGGVGYEVACSSRTLAALPPAGEPVTLSIDTHVRQDAIRLSAF
jgi:Holliday junction DNA helicase RuvA